MGAAMAGVDMTGFRPVKFAFGQIHISGGHGAKPMPVTSKSVSDPKGSNNTFVKMASTEALLISTRKNRPEQMLGWFVRSHVFVGGFAGQGPGALCLREMASSSSVEISSEDYDPMSRG